MCKVTESILLIILTHHGFLPVQTNTHSKNILDQMTDSCVSNLSYYISCLHSLDDISNQSSCNAF